MTVDRETFDWPSLMRLGLGTLGLPPRTFWALTPVELAVMAGLAAGPASMDRSALRALVDQYPDGSHKDDD